ncbi:MAG: aminotransferase class IV [Bacteroidota bacterium]|nr:aminotransferase class IV [Bacteroidota bacterium]
MYHFLNGNILPESEASILINDLSILRGYGIFDYLRTYKKKPFLLKKYLSRFFNSASIAGLPVPYDSSEIEIIIKRLICLSPYDELGIRLVLTGGYSFDAYTMVKPNFFILAEKFNAPPQKDFNLGVNILSYQYQRDFTEAKLLNYSSSIIFNSRNAQKKAAEILYHYQGRISEASRSNFFVVYDDRLITAGEHILKGITRDSVLSLAQGHFNVEETNFPFDRLSLVDEAFITSTTKGIMPVIKIDDLIIGNGTVGKSTAHLIQLYNDFVQKWEQ